MRWIVGTSLKLRFLVMFIAAAMIFIGITQLRDMPVDVFPEFAPPRVEIQTPAVGYSAAEVESIVTVPMEEVLAGVPDIDVLRSKSVPQLSSILMIFKPGTDVMHARQLVQERLASVYADTIPTDVAPPVMLEPLSSTARFMKIGITSSEMPLTDLSMIAYWKIRARLLGIPGVANVAIWGERLKMVQVKVDPVLLRKNDVTLNEVMEATADSLDTGLLQYSEGAVIGTGGFIDTPNQRLQVRNLLSVITPDNLAEVTFVTDDGRLMRLGDVGTVEWDHQPLIGDSIIENAPGLLLIVEKFPWANTLETTRLVDEALEAMQPGLPGVTIDAEIFRPATFIKLSIDNLTKALIIASILVVVVLLLFLFEWRTALISLVAIPLSLIAAALALFYLEVSMNTMVLAGFVIALGSVVDDAIIDVENITRRLREQRRDGIKKSTATVVLQASLEVRNAIVFATLIIVAALLPVFFLEGLSGAFFKPLALSYTLALAASMVVALTVTPALSLILLRNAPLERRESPLVRWLQRGYDAVLSRIVRSPIFAYGIVAVVVAAGGVVYPLLGQSLLPSFKERDFLMHWLTKPGTSLPEMQRITIQVSNELRQIPGVRNFGAHIGQALIMDEVVGIYFGENWISVDPSVDYDQTLEHIQATVDGYPGIFRDVQTYLRERIREVLTGTSDAIVVRIFGQDLDVLRDKAEEVRQGMEQIEGIVDLHVELLVDVPQIEIEVDLEAAQQHGLKPGDVRRAAAALLAGIEVGDIFYEGKAYDVAVWSVPQSRDSLTDIQELLIDTPVGGRVRLEEVADVRIVPTPNTIKRENRSRRLDIEANVEGRDLGSVTREVEDLLDDIQWPLEYRPELLGEYAERQAAQARLRVLAIVSAVIIFMLLQASFGSWRLATVSFLTLPMALVGGALAAYITGGTISLGSLVGFLTVLGIAARNGIMMVNHFQHLETEEGETFGPELVLRGARERLAPILMTAITTALALTPLVITGDIPGHEVEHPMAIVILGGLVTSTLLNLFVIPSLYLRFGRSRATGSPVLATSA